jgi:ATP-dependent Lon protease
VNLDQTLAELVLPAAPDTPEFAEDVGDSDVARKPTVKKWKHHR